MAAGELMTRFSSKIDIVDSILRNIPLPRTLLYVCSRISVEYRLFFFFLFFFALVNQSILHMAVDPRTVPLQFLLSQLRRTDGRRRTWASSRLLGF